MGSRYSDKRKIKEFVTRKPILKEWVNKFSKEKGNDKRKRLENLERRNNSRMGK